MRHDYPLNGHPTIFFAPVPPLICRFVTLQIRGLFPSIQSLKNLNRGVMVLLLSVPRFSRTGIPHPAGEGSAPCWEYQRDGENENNDTGDCEGIIEPTKMMAFFEQGSST